jgi:hypothetical protein
MEILEHIMFWSAFVLCIGWLAVFILAFSSHRRGTMPRFFSGGRSGHGLVRMPPRAWWQNLVLVPVACILVPIFGVCWLIIIPPMFIIERWIFKI